VSDILKILVDAELKKDTSLESSMDAIVNKYKTIDVEIRIKDSKSNKGMDDGLIKKLEENIKSLQGQVKKLEGEISNSLTKGFTKGKEQVGEMEQSVEQLLKTIKKVKLGENGKVVDKTVNGNKFVTKTRTSVDNEPTEVETTKNYKAVIKLYDSMIAKSNKWEGINNKELSTFRDMLENLRKIEAVTGKNKGKTLDLGSEKFVKEVEKVESKYNKLIEDEKKYQSIISERNKLLTKINNFGKADKNLLADKDMNKLNKDINSVSGLKTNDGMVKRLQQASDLYDELIRKNNKLVSEQKFKDGNQKRLDEKLPFVEQRMGNVKNFVDGTGTKPDYIDEKEFERVKAIFAQLDVEAKDFKVQLKMAEQELKNMENHAQGLSNLQDAQNDQRKKMNLDIKKDRQNEKATNMISRGVVPADDVRNFKDMSSALDMRSTKKDVEDVEKEYRRLIDLERESNRLNREREKASNQEQQDMNRRSSTVHSLTESMKNLEATTARALNGKNINVEQYNRLEQELKEVEQQIDGIRNSNEQLDDEKKRQVENQINDAKRLMAGYRQMIQLQEQENRESNRRDSVHSREGSTSNVAEHYTNNLDVSALNSANTRDNQQELQRQITETTRALLAQNSEYGRISESMVQVSRTSNSLGEDIYRVSYAIDRGNRNFEDYNLTVNATNGQVRDLGRNMARVRPEMSALSQLGSAMSKVPIWAMATSVMYGAVQFIERGFQMVLDFDKEMINLKKVANESRDELVAFEADAHSLAITLGVTASEVAKSATEFSRLGYSLSEAQGLAKTALIYANVGDMGVEDASVAIISTLKGFGVAEKDSVETSKRYSDMFNEVGNNFAISSAGIGEALKRSSAILHQAGNSVEQSIGLITAANTTIQNPEAVGTALKTISMRLRGVDEEGTKVVGLVPELEKYFKRFHSSMMLDANTFKPTFDIMGELASHWSELTDIQKAQITELIGGKRQGSIISSMMENWKDATDSYASALNSAGSAQKEFDKYTDSYQYKIGQLTASTEAFWTSFLDSSSVKTAIGALTGFMQMLTKLNDMISLLPILTGVFMAFIALAHKGTRELVLFGRGMFSFGISVTRARIAMGLLGGALKRFVMLSAPMLALSFAIDIMAKAYTKASRAREENLRVMRDEYDQNQQLIKGYDDLVKDGSMAKFKDLSAMDNSGEDMSVTQRKDLLDVQEKIKEVMPDVIDYYNEEHEAVFKTADQIERLVDLKRKEQVLDGEKKAKAEVESFDFNPIMDSAIDLNASKAKLKLQEPRHDGAEIFKDWFNEIKHEMDNMDTGEIMASYQKMLKRIQKELSTKYDAETAQTFLGGMDGITRTIQNGGNEKVMQKYFNEFVIGVEDGNGKLTKSFNNAKKKFESNVSELNTETEQLSKAFIANNHIDENTNEAKLVEDYAKSFGVGLQVLYTNQDEYIKHINGFSKEMKSVKGLIEDEHIDLSKLFEGKGDWSEIEKLDALSKSEKVNGAESAVLRSMVEKLTQDYKDLSKANDGTAQSFDMSQQEIAQLSQKYEEAVGNIAFLNKTLEELKTNHELGADTMGQLLDKYPELISAMGSEASMSEAIGKALVDETNIAHKSLSDKLMYNNEFYQKSLKLGDTFFDDLINNKYVKDLNGFKNLAEAKSKVTENIINALGGAWASYFSQTADGMADLNDKGIKVAENVLNSGAFSGAKKNEYSHMIGTLGKVNNEINRISVGFKNISLKKIDLSTNFSNVGMSDKKDSKDKKADKASEPDYQSWVDAWLKEKMANAERLDMQKEEIDNKIRMYDEEENYAKKLIETNNLLSNRKQEMNELNKVNAQLTSAMSKYNKSWVDSTGGETSAYVKSYNASSKETQDLMKSKFDELSALKKAYADNAKEVASLGYEIKSIQHTIDQLKVDNLKKEMEKLSTYIDETWNAFERLKTDMERQFSYLNEGDDAGKIALIKQRLDLLYKERGIINDNIKRLQEERKTLAGQPELLKENADALIKWGEQQKDLNVEIIGSQNEVKDVYKELADKVIQDYKDAIERQKDAELDALDKTKEAEDKRHDARMKNLDDEMSAYEKSIQQQLDTIDKQENNDSYDKDLSTKQVERQKILDKVNEYSMDNTSEGRKQLALLKEELSQKEQEIEQFSHDRQVELRKDALNQELEDKRSQVEKLKADEDVAHEKRLSGYETERTELNAHYENLLADERKWNQIRQDIMNENFSNITSDMVQFANDVSASAVRIGDNISKNINAELQTSIDLMAKLKLDKLSMGEINNKPTTPPPTPTTPPVVAKPVVAKPVVAKPVVAKPVVAKPAPPPPPHVSSGTSAGSLPLRKRSGGFDAPRGGWDKYSVSDYLKSKSYYADFSDRDKLYRALVGGGYSGSNSQNDSLLSKLKTVTGLKSGGFTGDWGESGKLAFLHQKELVLNKFDTSNVLKTVELVRDAQKFVPTTNPNVNVQKEGREGNRTGDIHLHFNIEKLEGGEKGAKTMIEKINDTLKRKGLK
jgi:TP901 family phage tail tape measure protein